MWSSLVVLPYYPFVMAVLNIIVAFILRAISKIRCHKWRSFDLLLSIIKTLFVIFLQMTFSKQAEPDWNSCIQFRNITFRLLQFWIFCFSNTFLVSSFSFIWEYERWHDCPISNFWSCPHINFHILANGMYWRGKWNHQRIFCEVQLWCISF